MNTTPNKPMGCCCSPAEGEPRRGFLAKTTAVVAAGVACAVPMTACKIAFLSPLGQQSEAGAPMRLARLEGLPDDGTPVRVPVVLDVVDGWSRMPNQPVGAVFLRKIGKDQVLALQAECPHAGCAIAYDPQRKDFVCPCHLARFDLDGKRTDSSSESPRDLDALEAELQGSEVWVQFARFIVGRSKKTAKA
jgi:menaquinol-cytochrome c reductase iron-sulfur subunit